MPYILATLSGIAAGIVVWLFDQPELPRTVPVATMTVGIVVSSFTATQRNMLLGMNTSIVLRRAARANYLEHIFDYLKQTIWFGMATTVVSVIGLFVDGKRDIGIDLVGFGGGHDHADRRLDNPQRADNVQYR